MTAASVDGRVARKQGTRESIMAAATGLFAARGVTSTSIDDIAEAAGIAKGSIYYNFDSKAGLVEAILERSAELVSQALDEASRSQQGKDVQAGVVIALLSLLSEHPGAAQVVVTEMFRTERSWREAIQHWRALAFAPLIADLERGGMDTQRAGLRAALIVGATLTTGLEWLVFHPELERSIVVDSILDGLNLAK